MNDNKFLYTYSSDSMEEVENIRRKYMPHKETPLEKLRKLDNSVADKATAVSLIFGVISTLVLGVGMCCCLVWTQLFMVGILVGLVGIIGICMAYPMYKKMLEKERQKIAPQILKLTDEIQKNK